MSRASGSDRASRSSLLTTSVSPARTAAIASRGPGRARFVPVRPDMLPTERGDMSQEIVGSLRGLSAEWPDCPVEIDRVPVEESSGDEAQAGHHVGCGFDFRLAAVRALFVATRRAAASATRAHVRSSSGSLNSRSGARQKERSIVQPFFS